MNAPLSNAEIGTRNAEAGRTPRSAFPVPLSAHILIAEDSPTQAEQLRDVLETHGYRVTVARNGREALDAMRQRPPTMVITDIVMPEMDGYELCRQIKADPALSGIPVMLLTSLSDPVDVIRGLECGADSFNVKPWEERYLLSRIACLLANQQLREADKAQLGIEIFFVGKKFLINSDRLQILNLLLSTYETAVEQNGELAHAQDELRTLNEQLEEKVRERTLALETEITEHRQTAEALRQQAKELLARNHELTLFNRAAVGRELRMIELKHEVNERCHRLGEPPRHAMDLPQDDSVLSASPDPAVAVGILPAVSGGILPLGSKPDERL